MMRFFAVVCCCLLVVAVVGCTSAVQQTKTATAPDDEPYRFEKDGQVPPPDEAAMRREVDRVDVFEETPVAETLLTAKSQTSRLRKIRICG